MKYALYTGCVAKGAGKELYTATFLVAEKLGIELVEMTDAACCGAGVIHEGNPFLADVVNARTFASAEEQGLDIMTICGTCQGVLVKTLKKLTSDDAYKKKVNAELAEIKKEFKGTVKVKGLTEIILQDYGLDKLKEKVVNPLKGVKSAPFYGCYTLRPSENSYLENPDNPDELEKLIKALGAEPVDYPERLACCGFPILMMNKKNSLTMGGNAINGAKNAGADCLVTPCPLCFLSFDSYQFEMEKYTSGNFGLPVLHTPQLIGLALGIDSKHMRMNTHITTVESLLEKTTS
ncbi:MAG: CoB--CoM heterodisulfide reductase iron-sulfur subunit B family protein [Nitrospinae bacterium]|nr:CoB--CoM heterodisulfide reductase iron-sulfur subunit B family protein [Nitrospinota bacterium]